MALYINVGLLQLLELLEIVQMAEIPKLKLALTAL